MSTDINVSTNPNAAGPPPAPAQGYNGQPQAYQVAVPFSNTVLTLGDAAGGAGASLVTLGNVMADAHGTMTIQAHADLTGQTTSGLSLLAASGIEMSSAAKVTIYAGGGDEPGACGSGSAAVPKPGETPGEKGEHSAEVAGALMEVGRGVVDLGEGASRVIPPGHGALNIIRNVVGAGGVITKGVSDIQTGVAELRGDEEAAHHAEQHGQMGDAVAGLAGLDPADVVNGISNAAVGSGAMGKAAGAQGGVDIEKKATGEIAMTCNVKLSGMAPDQILWQTPTQFTVAAGAVVDFTTIKWGAFGLAAVKIKTNAVFKAASTCFEFVGGVGKASAGSDMKFDIGVFLEFGKLRNKFDGVLTVTGDSTIEGELKVEYGKKTTIHEEVEVKKKTTMHGTLEVKKKVVSEGNWVIHQDVVFNGEAEFHGKKKTRKGHIHGELKLA